MPRCKVIIWNVECFGNFNNLKKGPLGSNRIQGTLWAIAQVILAYQADVVVMQEFRAAGAVFLPGLQTYLDAGVPGTTWNFDYLPGSIRDTVAPALNAVTNIADLDYISTGNSEGYAVFWKGTIPLLPFISPVPSPDVKMSHGMNGVPANQGYINLITESHAYTEVDNAPLPIQLINPPVPPNIPAGFPKPNSDVVGMTSTKRTRSHASVTYRREILQWKDVRRPCIIKISATTSSTGFIPIIAHHGPNGGMAPLYSVIAASLSPYFFGDGGAGAVLPVIYGGDLNTTTQNELYWSEQNLNWFNLASATGTYSTAPNTNLIRYGFTRSQTQYEYPAYAAGVGLITTGNNYESPRDILYHRDLTNVTPTGVIDVLADLQNAVSGLSIALFTPPVVANPLLTSLNQILADQVAGINSGYWLPDAIKNDAAVLANLSVPFTAAGACPNILTAAILYRCFITDHLPLAIEFDI
ncbi:hypothetical protein V3O24_09740 [Methylobacter sp. Wu8]|uniref:Endonuclease/exonuclease/phosphatase domain-containing protein n=1 Tax=Methylobacter tundripaludum TaxID=173365 RepID=A0A2S6H4N4_9GAMM|nr:hypothetical protein [Methylobacter tundripaludum]MCK9636016.1 hypothetical protein [Methylobacter tundripaludum]PPK72403.1 hypothetical protein B0F88_104197 [Methylobacter tundripaludum]